MLAQPVLVSRGRFVLAPAASEGPPPPAGCYQSTVFLAADLRAPEDGHLPDAEKPRRTLDAATEGGGLAVVEPETLIAPCVVAFPIAPSARHRRY